MATTKGCSNRKFCQKTFTRKMSDIRNKGALKIQQGRTGERETNKYPGFKLINPFIWEMHQSLHAIRTGFISITVNNNDKYIYFFFLGSQCGLSAF